MLQRIRDGASGPLAYIVVGIIAVVFGVWGIGSYFTPSSDPTVATAGDTEIKQSQLQRGFDQRYQQLRQVMGDSFDSSVFPPGEVRRSVLQRLIDQAVVTQYAKDNGYRVSDADSIGMGPRYGARDAEIAIQNVGQACSERGGQASSRR